MPTSLATAIPVPKCLSVTPGAEKGRSVESGGPSGPVEALQIRQTSSGRPLRECREKQEEEQDGPATELGRGSKRPADLSRARGGPN